MVFGNPFGANKANKASNAVPPEIARALEAVQKILDQNKNPMAAADVDHQYEDKYALVEFMANTGIAATLNVLDQLDGFNQEVLTQIIAVVQEQKRSMTLRLSVEEDCEFLQETNRTVESPSSHRVTVSTTEGGGTPTNKVVTHKVVQEVKEFHWKCGIRSTLMLFAGTDHQHGIVLGTRTGTTNLVTSMKKRPFPPHTRPPIDLDLTWLINQLSKDTLLCSFKIDREDAKTPRRNKQTEECLRFVNGLGSWAIAVAHYFRATVLSELLRGLDEPQPCPAQWLSKVDTTGIFTPVAPLFQEYTKEETDDAINENTPEQAGLVLLPSTPAASPIISLKDTTLFLKEQCSSLQNALLSLMGNFPDPADQGQLISGYEAKLVLLSLHLFDVAQSWSRGVEYVEQMLYNQMVSAVGKEVRAEDFDAFLKFHNQRLFGKNYAPRPFCHAIRQPNQYPDGVLSIVAGSKLAGNPHIFGGQDTGKRNGDAIETFSKHIPGDSLVSPMSIPLNAATTVDFLGDQYLHGWLDTQFAGEQPVEHFISARARQFSCFLLLVGNISGPDEFTPKDAIILQNKDEVLIPLLTAALPSAKEFRDAIQSLSPEQARFAKSFRSMQLDSSVFGVCVIQVKPQMEALLDLPPNALTKEIQLTQDLLSLFVEYQIPPNLVSYDGDESAPVAEKVDAVKQHTKGVLDVIKDIKDAQLAEETKKAEMRAEQVRQAKKKQEMTERADCERSLRVHARRNVQDCTATSPAGRFGGVQFASAISAAPQAMSAPAGFRAHAPARAAQFENQSHCVAEALEFDECDFDDLQDQFDSIDLEKKKEGDKGKQQEEKDWMLPSSQTDFTAIPKKLDRMFETFDKDGALRSMTIKTEDQWTRSRQENLLTKMKTSQLSTDDKKNESNKALDLLDALSRSGSLPVSSGELHVIIGVRHSFEKNVMSTVIQDSMNPVERVDYSSLLIGASVHHAGIPTLLANSAEPPSFLLKSRQFPPLMMGEQAEAEIDGGNDL